MRHKEIFLKEQLLSRKKLTLQNVKVVETSDQLPETMIHMTQNGGCLNI